MWKNKKALITGGNGFLASWLVKKLKAKDADVYALIYEEAPLSIFELENLDQKVNVIKGDVRDFTAISSTINDVQADIVFHVAAQSINKTAIEQPYKTLETNVHGAYNILEAVRTLSPRTKLIVASSDKAYGSHKEMPYNEDFSLHGEYPYEVSKSCADLITSAYCNTYNTSACIVRSGNIYGGGDWHFSRVVPATILRVLNNQPPILISETERDYIYVDDVSDGYIKLGEAMLGNGLKGEAFNFGNGGAIKTSDLIKLILNIMDKNELGFEKSSEERMEIPVQFLSTKKADDILGFAAKTKLEDGLRETVKWYTKHIDLIDNIKIKD